MEPSRREILKAAALAGAATLARPLASAFATASQPRTPVNFKVPANACDCHTHVFGDPRKYPLAEPRLYTTESATVEELQALHRALHTPRVVIVQPTLYGPDPSCMLDAIRQIGKNARGIAEITDRTSHEELDRMHRGGVRGIRIHVDAPGPLNTELVRKRFRDAAERIKGRDWHIEVVTFRLAAVVAIKDDVLACPAPTSFDAWGGVQPGLGLSQPGFDTFLSLIQSGKAYVNLSAPDVISKQAPDYPDMAPLARAFIATNPRGIIWGTNWPHPPPKFNPNPAEMSPLAQVDDGRALNRLATWTDNAAQLKLILVDNPACLYGF
jgi:predicted TIM-barrel fold metal-dependent hydrolase